MANIKKFGRLHGRIVEKYGTIGAFADAVGMSRIWVSAKLNGGANFTANDIRRWCKLLEIEPEQIGGFFYPES